MVKNKSVEVAEKEWVAGGRELSVIRRGL